MIGKEARKERGKEGTAMTDVASLTGRRGQAEASSLLPPLPGHHFHPPSTLVFLPFFPL